MSLTPLMPPALRSAAPLLALVLLVGCGPSTDSASGPGGDRGRGALPDTAMVRDVAPETTAALVGGDLAEASPSVAIQTLDLWIARLDTASAPGAGDIRDDLETLRNLLQSYPLDGPAIGRALRDAGQGTAAVADSAAGLAELARTLQAAGGRLAPDTTATRRGPNGESVQE